VLRKRAKDSLEIALREPMPWMGANQKTFPYPKDKLGGQSDRNDLLKIGKKKVTVQLGAISFCGLGGTCHEKKEWQGGAAILLV